MDSCDHSYDATTALAPPRHSFQSHRELYRLPSDTTCRIFLRMAFFLFQEQLFRASMGFSLTARRRISHTSLCVCRSKRHSRQRPITCRNPKTKKTDANLRGFADLPSHT